MKTLGLLLATAAIGLTVSSAHGTLVVSGSVGGAPTGITLDNLDNLTPGGGSPQNTTTGIVVSFAPDGAVVQGSSSGFYAAPFLSGSNGNGFGSPNQPNGVDTTPYLTSGSTGNFPAAQITLVLPAQQQYFGLLWGSVDDYNTLSFYDGIDFVGSLTGLDVTASPDGDQGANGTLYVNINSDVPFDRVVATSTRYAFEFDNVAYNSTQVLPEPASLALLGSAVIGFGLFRRRRNRA